MGCDLDPPKTVDVISFAAIMLLSCEIPKLSGLKQVEVVKVVKPFIHQPISLVCLEATRGK